MLSYSDVGLIIFQLAKPCRSEKNVQMGIWYFSNIDVATFVWLLCLLIPVQQAISNHCNSSSRDWVAENPYKIEPSDLEHYSSFWQFIVVLRRNLMQSAGVFFRLPQSLGDGRGSLIVTLAEIFISRNQQSSACLTQPRFEVCKLLEESVKMS